MQSFWRYFSNSIWATLLGLSLGAWAGYLFSGTWHGAAEGFFLTAVLAVLEVSLSFDNAIVNASVLRQMSPQWRHRFITWGMLIAVFGMRILFPLVIVSVAAKISPWAAADLATRNPQEYSRLMHSAHIGLAGFGGSFLMMVALRFFINEHKTEHWLSSVEKILSRLGKVEAVEVALCLGLLFVLTRFLPEPEAQMSLLGSGVLGLVTYVLVDGISSYLKLPEDGQQAIEKASAALFVYLELVDASFSFDGVIGAFALTNNLIILAAGLGIGAMFVRSLTIFLVEKQTLEAFRYLEHGAFYAIGVLAVMMMVDVFIALPEWVIGLAGGSIILTALWASKPFNPPQER